MMKMANLGRIGIGAPFDFAALPSPKLPPMDLPLDAGSLSPDGGGADGGGEPAPAPSPGEPAADFPVFDVPVGIPTPPPAVQYAYPVQEVPQTPVVVQTPSPAIPTWAIAAGAAVAGVAVASLLLGRKGK
jgi:hypothetical protein